MLCNKFKQSRADYSSAVAETTILCNAHKIQVVIVKNLRALIGNVLETDLNAPTTVSHFLTWTLLIFKHSQQST